MTATNYLDRWRRLTTPARLYLLHAALLTASLAIWALFFNLAVLALGYSREFLGILNAASIGVAALASVPLWWLVTRIGLRTALLANALLQAISAAIFVLWPQAAPLLLASAQTGIGAVLFQVSAPPFMMRHSDDDSRDHLFSANAGINIGVGGFGKLLAGGLPALFAVWLGVDAESGLAYRATFAVAGVGLLLSIVPLLLIRERARPPHERSPAGDRSAPAASLTSIVRSIWRTLRTTRMQRWFDHLPEPWYSLHQNRSMLFLLLIPPFLISWGAALLIPYLNLFFKESFGISDAALGAILAALDIATGGAALLAPVISMRIGKARTIVIMQAVSIPFLLLMGFAPLLSVAIAAALARGAFFNMGAPLYDAFAMERTAEPARPIVIGLINGAYSLGYLGAPIISTRVQAQAGFTPLFVATAIFYMLAIAATYWFFVRGDRASAHRAATANTTEGEPASNI